MPPIPLRPDISYRSPVQGHRSSPHHRLTLEHPCGKGANALAKSDFDIGYDRIHGDVVVLRTDGVDLLEVETDADRERPGMERGQRSIKIAASESEPVTLRVESDDRRDDDIGQALFAAKWNRDVQDAACQFLA